MDKLIKDIMEYTLHLKKELQCSVSFIYDHFPQKYFEILLPVIAHENRYCEAIKKHLLTACVQDKFSLLKKNMERPIIGRCHAGVQQLIFPARVNNKTVNLVMLSEHKSRLHPDFKTLSSSLQMPTNTLIQKYNTLPDSFLKTNIKIKINPLVHMLELYYIYSKDFEDKRLALSNDKKIFNKAMNFILENYKNQIDLPDVCNYCNYSSTFLNNLFKKFQGMTIKQYIINLKMKQAAQLLLTTDKNIIEIAECLGYNDSNYFTNQFNKYYKTSPTNYRKKNS